MQRLKSVLALGDEGRRRASPAGAGDPVGRPVAAIASTYQSDPIRLLLSALAGPGSGAEGPEADARRSRIGVATGPDQWQRRVTIASLTDNAHDRCLEHALSLSHRPPSLLPRRKLLRGALGATALPTLGWPLAATAAKAKPLQVGGLPVTCNLTLPVACVARATANGAAKGVGPQFEFEFSKYTAGPRSRSP